MNPSRTYFWIYLLAIGGYAWLTFNLLEVFSNDVTICMFKQATGFPCPSCGTTRSLQAIITGNLAGALAINPFGYLAAGFLLLFPFLVIYQLIVKKPIVVNSIQYFEKVLRIRTVAIILILLVLANWYWNITKGL